MGRSTCHRHEPHVRSCEIFRRRHLEVGRVEREGYEWYVSWRYIVQWRPVEVGRVKGKGYVLDVLGCDIFQTAPLRGCVGPFTGKEDCDV